MWTVSELLSSLFGYWAMGCGIWLFCPEIYDVVKYRPREIDAARLTFFASWLLGDFLHLFGTVFSGHAQITQISLYIIVAVLETFLVIWILYNVYCAKRHHAEEFDKVDDPTTWRHPAQHAFPHMLGVGPQLHMPPGDDALDKQKTSRRERQIDAANASRRARGKKTPWKPPKAIPRPTMIAIQVAGTVFVLLVSTAVWYGATYTQQSVKEPPEPLPQSLIAFIPGWAGKSSSPSSSYFPLLPPLLPSSSSSLHSSFLLLLFSLPLRFCFWVGPRLFSMYQSYKDKQKEGITTATIIVGALTHGFNTASIMLINYRGEGLLAQSPYIATSVCCIVLDIFRFFLKRHYADQTFLPPNLDHSTLYPARAFYDPAWQHEPKEKAPRSKRERLASVLPSSSRKKNADDHGAARRGLLEPSGPAASSDEEAHGDSGEASGLEQDEPRRRRASRNERSHPRSSSTGGESGSDVDVDAQGRNPTQRHAAYLQAHGWAAGALGLGAARQLHPELLPYESEHERDDRLLTARANKAFLARREPQLRRLDGLDDAHAALDARRAKTLRRQEEHDDPSTSARRKREIERQLHATEHVHEPALRARVDRFLKDPDVEHPDDRDELERRHGAWAASVADEEERAQAHPLMHKAARDRVEKERLEHAGRAYSAWEPGATLSSEEERDEAGRRRPESMDVERPSEADEEAEHERAEQKRRLRVAKHSLSLSR
ncbi:hypothetical protein JCM8208_007430 [Rhodotorula glutinis]